MAIEKDMLDQLLVGRDPQDLFARNGPVDKLERALSQRLPNAERGGLAYNWPQRRKPGCLPGRTTGAHYRTRRRAAPDAPAGPAIPCRVDAALKLCRAGAAGRGAVPRLGSGAVWHAGQCGAAGRPA